MPIGFIKILNSFCTFCAQRGISFAKYGNVDGTNRALPPKRNLLTVKGLSVTLARSLVTDRRGRKRMGRLEKVQILNNQLG